jgi:DNA-binding Xre family transcriptional regulator
MNEASNIICKYIYRNWIESYKSQRSFALDHNIEESIVRKIKNTALRVEGSNYNIPVNTLNKICEARNIKLSEFFKLIDK